MAISLTIFFPPYIDFLNFHSISSLGQTGSLLFLGFFFLLYVTHINEKTSSLSVIGIMPKMNLDKQVKRNKHSSDNESCKINTSCLSISFVSLWGYGIILLPPIQFLTWHRQVLQLVSMYLYINTLSHRHICRDTSEMTIDCISRSKGFSCNSRKIINHYLLSR